MGIHSKKLCQYSKLAKFNSCITFWKYSKCTYRQIESTQVTKHWCLFSKLAARLAADNHAYGVLVSIGCLFMDVFYPGLMGYDIRV